MKIKFQSFSWAGLILAACLCAGCVTNKPLVKDGSDNSGVTVTDPSYVEKIHRSHAKNPTGVTNPGTVVASNTPFADPTSVMEGATAPALKSGMPGWFFGIAALLVFGIAALVYKRQQSRKVSYRGVEAGEAPLGASEPPGHGLVSSPPTGGAPSPRMAAPKPVSLWPVLRGILALMVVGVVLCWITVFIVGKLGPDFCNPNSWRIRLEVGTAVFFIMAAASLVTKHYLLGNLGLPHETFQYWRVVTMTFTILASFVSFYIFVVIFFVEKNPGNTSCQDFEQLKGLYGILPGGTLLTEIISAIKKT